MKTTTTTTREYDTKGHLVREETVIVDNSAEPALRVVVTRPAPAPRWWQQPQPTITGSYYNGSFV